MFLTNDNKLLWRTMWWGTFVVAVLVIVGCLGLDKHIYMWTAYTSDWNLWQIFARFFDAKLWLVVSAIILAVYGVKRFVKTIRSVQNREIQFKFSDIFKETWLKTKTSNAFLIFSSVFCASVLAWMLKVIIARLRPVFVMSGQIPEFDRFAWAWHSMPSGHTTVTFAGLVMIGMLAPRYKPITWTLAVVVGISRICIGAHWFSDVVLGAFVGMLVADIVKWVFMKKTNILA